MNTTVQSQENKNTKQQSQKQKAYRLKRKVLAAVFSAVILAACTAGLDMGLVNAQEYTQPEDTKCYKSIEIQPGDSLWSIAEENLDAHYTSTDEYIEEIRQINHLQSDLIHSGRYLTIVYYK